MDIQKQLDRIVRDRILILDGAMGSIILTHKLGEAEYRGREFASHPVNLQGCNDLLCITRPGLISSIHEGYLKAGADIVTSCSFNATSVSLADYGLEGMAYEISRAAAALAREAAEKFSSPEKPRFVAGSMGPTSKSGSISPDMDDPGRRSISWDELEAAYYDNARGLLDGGAQILLLETIFDTLNAKAAIAAILRLREERNKNIPLMISATISDASGRILSGQTLEAFAVSVSHANPWSLGLNCSLGAEKILPSLAVLSSITPFLVSCHPNAGLPNNLGAYDEGPGETAAYIKEFLDRKLVNILGGCCGTTPEHIAAIADLAKDYKPRQIPAPEKRTVLAGLEPLPVGKEFIDIGERTNVAGSKKFLRLVQNNSWEEALDMTREMIAGGARIIDVCMDDALLPGKETMVRFLNLMLSDPEIARAPVMPDSSRWEILEAALKCIQGKGLVNSISLKEGEEEFLYRARLIRRYGAAAVVMLFDEQGQALSYERKIEIAERSYRILTGAGFPPADIVFDPNVLTIATGMGEHDRYALDFIRACAWIREHCPAVHISGGISNLSFSFRGNEEIRRALHAVFLKHAIDAGLSMGILNPAGIVSYDEVRIELRKAAEDAVLCRDTGQSSTDRLLALGAGEKQEDSGGGAIPRWRALAAEARIVHGLLKGIDKYIQDDVLELYARGLQPLEIIEGPLMQGIEEVGERFGEGKMFLPQVIRSARVMKKAVAALEPFMAGTGDGQGAGKIVLATVKGDVHDIGKNIVSVILGCNGYKVIDLGVMVPAEIILKTAQEANADCVGLSGLISPSLDEMVRVAEAMEKERFTLPLLIGGAATGVAHTSLRIAPAYSGPVVYVRDAGQTPPVIRSLLSPKTRAAFLEKLEKEYAEARRLHKRIGENRLFLGLEEARAHKFSPPWKEPPPPPHARGIISYTGYPLERVIPYIDWKDFYASWDLPKDPAADTPEGGGPGAAKGTEARQKFAADAEKLLERIQKEKLLSLRAVLGFFPALSEDEDIVLYRDGAGGEGSRGFSTEEELGRFCFLRNQEKKPAGGPDPGTAGPLGGRPNLCLADFILPKTKYLDPGAAASSADWLGLFALSAGFGLEEPVAQYKSQNDDYSALLLASLANRLAEAFAEELHERVRRELWGYSPQENLSRKNLFRGAYRGIRPAFGYAACPDHRDKELCFRLLEVPKRIGLMLTESAMISPAASICGMYFSHPQACYFGAGEIAKDQLEAWAKRKGISLEEARRRTGRITLPDE
ncbi:MAG: methionine synthase [Spirochaetaceae bacterium]|jgi:5-methyltetrahydrofolate--homocysteine methyltransferase|nr:methionine synthase [Spirochaetaceae bacterium]